MKHLLYILIFIICCGFTIVKPIKNVDKNIYDTIYIKSHYEYVVNDSYIKKQVINDTIHSLNNIVFDNVNYSYRIYKIDTIKNGQP